MNDSSEWIRQSHDMWSQSCWLLTMTQLRLTTTHTMKNQIGKYTHDNVLFWRWHWMILLVNRPCRWLTGGNEPFLHIRLSLQDCLAIWLLTSHEEVGHGTLHLVCSAAQWNQVMYQQILNLQAIHPLAHCCYQKIQACKPGLWNPTSWSLQPVRYSVQRHGSNSFPTALLEGTHGRMPEPWTSGLNGPMGLCQCLYLLIYEHNLGLQVLFSK